MLSSALAKYSPPLPKVTLKCHNFIKPTRIYLMIPNVSLCVEPLEHNHRLSLGVSLFLDIAALSLISHAFAYWSRFALTLVIVLSLPLSPPLLLTDKQVSNVPLVLESEFLLRIIIKDMLMYILNASMCCVFPYKLLMHCPEGPFSVMPLKSHPLCQNLPAWSPLNHWAPDYDPSLTPN